jgi:hypothetical protein
VSCETEMCSGLRIPRLCVIAYEYSIFLGRVRVVVVVVGGGGGDQGPEPRLRLHCSH